MTRKTMKELLQELHPEANLRFGEVFDRLAERLQGNFTGRDAQQHPSARSWIDTAEGWARLAHTPGLNDDLAFAAKIVRRVWEFSGPSISVGQEDALQTFYLLVKNLHEWEVRIGLRT